MADKEKQDERAAKGKKQQQWLNHNMSSAGVCKRIHFYVGSNWPTGFLDIKTVLINEKSERAAGVISRFGVTTLKCAALTRSIAYSFEQLRVESLVNFALMFGIAIGLERLDQLT